MLLTGRVSCEFLAKIFTMARVGIVFGLLLCGLTYAAMVWDPEKIPAQFIPMMFGIPLLFCGVVALNPHRRKASMQVATTVAGLGAGGGMLWCMTRGVRLATGKQVSMHGMTVIGIMSLLCVVFVALWLSGLFQMRRRQAAGGPFPSGTRPVGSKAGKSIDEAAGNKSDPEE